MNKHKLISCFLIFAFILTGVLSMANTGYAQELGGLGTSLNGSSSSSDNEMNSSITDYLQNYHPVTDENMQKAGKLATPIANAIGTLTGAIIIFVSAAIFFVTALDLCYIGLPFTRDMLAPSGGGGGGMPMGGGFGGGFGGRMGMGMGGGQQVSQKRWVSDEAFNLVNQMSGGGGQSMMGGGFGGGYGGGMNMGMGGGQQQPNTKSIIFEYLKKRSFFLIIFAVCTVLLTSSIFTDCGINLAKLLYKILAKFSGELTTVDIG